MRLSSMISAVDAHACGEPGRVIIGGVLDVPGRTMFEKKVYLEQHADHLRQRMLREPRGYPAMCCNVILPPTHPEADAGFVIMEQVEYPPMSGSNTICVVTVLIETGMVPAVEPVTELKLAPRPDWSRFGPMSPMGKSPASRSRTFPRLRSTSTGRSTCRSWGRSRSMSRTAG